MPFRKKIPFKKYNKKHIRTANISTQVSDSESDDSLVSPFESLAAHENTIVDITK